MKQFHLLILLFVLSVVGVRAQTTSQRLNYTTADPPTSCIPGHIVTNATTHKTYQGSSVGGCTRIDAGAATATPGGSNTQLQYNNSSAFGGVSGCTSNGTAITCTAANLLATSPRFTTGINDSNGNAEILLTATGSAVNNFTVANAASGAGPTLSSTGSGTNIDINILPKGTGTVNFALGTAANPAINFGTIGQGDGMFSTGNGSISLTTGGVQGPTTIANDFYIAPIGSVAFSATGAPGSSTSDIRVYRAAANVAGIGTSGSSPAGWINQAGRCFLAADQTNATTTFANVTGCSVSVTSGRKYVIKVSYFLADSTAADGVKLDFNGGAATATNFRVHCVMINDTGATVAATAAASTTLAGVLNVGTLTTVNQHEYKCEGTFEPSSTNTFIPRVAQNAHSTGTLTLFRGSYMIIEDLP